VGLKSNIHIYTRKQHVQARYPQSSNTFRRVCVATITKRITHVDWNKKLHQSNVIVVHVVHRFDGIQKLKYGRISEGKKYETQKRIQIQLLCYFSESDGKSDRHYDSKNNGTLR